MASKVERRYFRTNTKNIVDGLIENFRLDMLPANAGVRTAFGIMGDDDERLFDALKWMWDQGRIDREKLLELKDRGTALTAAVNVPDNPFAPIEYSTMYEFLNRGQETRNAAYAAEEARKAKEE